MPAVIVAIVSAVVAIGSVVYNIAKAVYDFVVPYIQAVTNIVNKIRDTIKEITSFLQDQVNYVLKITGVTALVDLTNGIRQFADLAGDISKGKMNSLLTVIGGLYQSVAGTAKDIIEFASNIFKGVTTTIATMKDDIKDISETQIFNINKQLVSFQNDIKAMNANLVSFFTSEVSIELKILKTGIDDRITIINGRILTIDEAIKSVNYFRNMIAQGLEY